jgi:hypothetical protein
MPPIAKAAREAASLVVERVNAGILSNSDDRYIRNLLIGPVAPQKSFPRPLGKANQKRYGTCLGLAARCDPK